MKKKHLISLLITFTLISGFSGHEGCKSLISSAMDKLNKAQISSQDKGMFLDYRVRTVFQSGDTQEKAEERIKAYANNGKSYLTSSRVDIYKDKLYQVSIMKEEKKIIISLLSKENRDNFNDLQIKNLIGIQDSLIKNSKVLNCIESNDDNEKQKQITLLPDSRIKKKTGIEKVTFWIEPEHMDFKKIRMDYTEEKKVKEIEMEILQTNFNYSGEIFSGSSLSKVISKDGKLLAPFSTYRLIDLRK